MSTQTIPSCKKPTSPQLTRRLSTRLEESIWEASDIPNKDVIHGTQEVIGDIIAALKNIEDSITNITKNYRYRFVGHGHRQLGP